MKQGGGKGPHHGKPPSGLPVLPSLPSSLSLAQPLHPQLCISEPGFWSSSSRRGCGTTGHEHISSLKIREILLNTEISFTHDRQTCLLFALNPDIFCRTPHEPSETLWISSERKKLGLQAEQPGTRGRLPAHQHSPLVTPTAGTGDWEHRGMFWELQEGWGKPGKVRGGWFGREGAAGRALGTAPTPAKCAIYPDG